MSRSIFVMLQSFVVGAAISLSGCDLLVNPSFESVTWTGTNKDYEQGNLPDDWVQAGPNTPGADTFTNRNLKDDPDFYGLLPGPEFNHFNNETFAAKHGIRWIGGADFLHDLREAVGQQLRKPLTPGTNYTLTAWVAYTGVYQSNDKIPGSWEVFLSSSNSYTTGAKPLGKLKVPTTADEWQSASLTFTAPSDAANLRYLVLAPYTTNSIRECYVGLDNVRLSSQSEARALDASRLVEDAIGLE